MPMETILPTLSAGYSRKISLNHIICLGKMISFKLICSFVVANQSNFSNSYIRFWVLGYEQDGKLFNKQTQNQSLYLVINRVMECDTTFNHGLDENHNAIVGFLPCQDDFQSLFSNSNAGWKCGSSFTWNSIISFCSLAALSIKQFKIIKIHNRIFNYGINRKGTEMIAQING
jgi:hypothetical protein